MPDTFFTSMAISQDAMQVIPHQHGIELRFSFEDQPDKLSFFLSPADAAKLVESINVISGHQRPVL